LKKTELPDKNKRKVNIQQYAIFIIFFALCVLLSILSPHFLTFSNFINVIRQASIYAILAFGMTFVMLTGMIDLSVGSVVALSSCITGFSLVDGYGIVISVFLGISTGLACGIINGLLISYNVCCPGFIAGYYKW